MPTGLMSFLAEAPTIASPQTRTFFKDLRVYQLEWSIFNVNECRVLCLEILLFVRRGSQQRFSRESPIDGTLGLANPRRPP